MATHNPRYWLMKSEPDVFSFADLRAKKRTMWDGVRNYMARNFMMRDMKVDDIVLFYHSNANPSGVAGLGRVSKLATPDPSQFDKKSEYYDAKSNAQNPRWHCVEVEFYKDLPRPVSLEEIKSEKRLANMILLKNSRLSVQPVTKNEFEIIVSLSENSKI